MTIKHPQRLLAVLLIAVAAAGLLLAGCVKSKLPTAPAASAQSVQSLKVSAERAVRQEDYVRAETLYRRLLDIPGLDTATEAQAWGGLAESAAHTGHYHAALEALENLARVDPLVQNEWSWHESYLEALKQLGRRDQAALHLRTLVGDPDRPVEMRIDAGLALSRELWSNGEYDQSLRTLADVYSLFASPADRARFESALAADLRETGPRTFDSLKDLAGPENEIEFPYFVIRLEQARRMTESPETFPMAWRILKRLSDAKAFAGPDLAANLLLQLEAKLGRPGSGVALVLPLTGAYAEVGWEIARGAGAAQWEMILAGSQIDVTILNSEASDIAERIRALPPDFAVVGGPLQTDVFKKLSAAGLMSEKPFLAFLPQLPEGLEGRDAWRFFPSPADEIHVLLDLAVNHLYVRRLAMLYPEEPYGYRRAELFRRSVAEIASNSTASSIASEIEGLRPIDQFMAPGPVLSAEASYNPAEPTTWGKAIAEMLGVPAVPTDQEGKPLLPPEPDFEAVFLPDNWSHAELLIPHFYFYEEDRLLFFGPALWGQALKHGEDIETRYYRLTLFPGPFQPDSDSLGVQGLKQALSGAGLPEPDFWVALGYDFIRLAARLGKPPAAHDPEAFNALLASASDMDWSMAPMSWDSLGKASQKLFLFQPSRDGIRPVDAELLYKRMVNAREAHEQRVQKLIEKQEEKKREKLQADLPPADQAELPAEGLPLSPEEQEVQDKLRQLLDSLEQRKNSEQQ